MPEQRQQKAQSIQVAGLSCFYQRQRRKTLRILVDERGDVWIACPWYLPEFFLRRAVEERLPWIHQRREQVLACRQPRRYMLQHLGLTYRIERRIHARRARVVLEEDQTLRLYLPEQATPTDEDRLLERWQRRELQRLLPDLIARWESRLGVEVAEWRIRQMRTRWGTCNTVARRLWFRLALVEQPLDCIDYVVAHECAHLRERGHNARFYALLDAHLPNRQELERALRCG